MQISATQRKAMQRHSKPKQCKAMQRNQKQCKAMRGNAKTCKPMPSNAKQRNAYQCKAAQSDATQSSVNAIPRRTSGFFASPGVDTGRVLATARDALHGTLGTSTRTRQRDANHYNVKHSNAS